MNLNQWNPNDGQAEQEKMKRAIAAEFASRGFSPKGQPELGLAGGLRGLGQECTAYDDPSRRDRSHLSEKLSDLGHQINDLEKLVAMLAEKLGPVRVVGIHGKNGPEVGECQPAMSDVCSDLFGKARTVRAICQQVDTLIKECEV